MPYDPKKFEAFKARANTPSDPASYLTDLWKSATTEKLDNAPGYDLLGQWARAGQFANEGNQQLAQMSAEGLGRAGVNPYVAAIPGTILGTLSEVNPLLPTNRLAAGLGVAGPLIGVARKLPGAISASREAVGLAGAGVGQSAQTIPEKARVGLSTLSKSLLGSNALPIDPSLPTSVTENPYFVKTSQKANNLINAEASLRGEKATPEFAQQMYQELHDAAHSAKEGLKAGTISKEEAGRVSDAFQRIGAKKWMDANPQQWVDVYGQVAPNKPGTLAQLITARAGRANGKITPTIAQYALDNPKVLDNAKSITEATKDYVEAIGGLKNKTQSLSERLNKTVIRSGDYDNAIDRAGRLLNGTPIETDGALKLTPQDAVEGLQSINQALRDKMYTQSMHPDQVKKIMQVKEGLLNYLQNNGSPKIREAGKALFEAHVSDAFKDWLPKNKYGSPDALRTGIGMMDMAKGIGAVGGGLLHGAVGAGIGYGVPVMANAAMASPRVAGQLIREISATPGAFNNLSKMRVGVANMLGDKQ